MTVRRPSEGEEMGLDDHHPNLDPIVTGEHCGLRYRIYRIPSADGNPSHYAAYARVSFVDAADIANGTIPTSPAYGTINFGPTDDGWIGFGTIDGRNHNYRANMTPLEDDHRDAAATEAAMWTPQILHDAVLEWLTELVEWRNTV